MALHAVVSSQKVSPHQHAVRSLVGMRVAESEEHTKGMAVLFTWQVDSVTSPPESRDGPLVFNAAQVYRTRQDHQKTQVARVPLSCERENRCRSRIDPDSAWSSPCAVVAPVILGVGIAKYRRQRIITLIVF